MGGFGILASVPWGKIVTYAPTIIDTAGKLLDSVRSRFGKKVELPPAGNASDSSIAALADRIAALESNEVRQAELVSTIAQQLGSLSTALQVLSQRVALAFFLSLTAIVAAIILAVIVLSR
jgi:hypothetical protein